MVVTVTMMGQLFGVTITIVVKACFFGVFAIICFSFFFFASLLYTCNLR